ncbi:MAG: ferrous iron transport protein B [Lachnospiraceae bacterium]|jgi:ferrous iron transport protein B|nr:ferrous iron transport protein B [Lachnospiraceae bacterium]MEE3461972.1 ferrous iron transport protein B [Lachnospiraceae bacterium]
MSTRIALAGNPNCGKTTMFNALTGGHQYVGNWPGVTVEKKEAYAKHNKEVMITDLPGVYSLSPYTLEEVVTRDYLVNETPDAIIDLVDATNIERNLYLTSQILELGIPVVIALNMMDIVKKNGDVIDINKLEKDLGVKVVPTSALRKEGLDKVVDEAVMAAKNKNLPKPVKFSDDIETALEKAEGAVSSAVPANLLRWYAVKFLENDEKYVENASKLGITSDMLKAVEDARKELETAEDDDAESVITDARYNVITEMVRRDVKKKSNKLSLSDKIDKVVTNRILGLPIFVVVMFVIYYISVTWLGTIVTDWTNDVFVGEWCQGGAEAGLTALGASPILIDLIVNGIIGGIGTVLGFAPQIALVMFLLSILEDVGYMARVAFVMDRIFRKFGLSGKSFIPLMIGSGCGVPGIMSTKTIENDTDRRITITTTTFVPCGAKLPVIAVIAGVLTRSSGAVTTLMYFIGVFCVLISGVILKKFKKLAGKPAPFIMELPAYHVPSVKNVLMHTWERLKGYLIKAGTIIFLCCAVMWFLSSYGMENGAFGLVEDSANSLLGVIGTALAFLFIPLGFGSWQAVSATLSGFVAKESLVSTIAILVTGEETDEATDALVAAFGNAFPAEVQGSLLGLAAFCFLLFNLLDSPCLAAVSTLVREMQSGKWTAFALIYQNLFAYVVTLAVFQIGKLIITGTFTAGTVFGILGAIAILVLFFRPDPYKNSGIEAKRSVAA